MNTTPKFVVVLNEKIAPGVAMNAASHMCLSMVAQATAEQKAAMQFIDYYEKVYNRSSRERHDKLCVH